MKEDTPTKVPAWCPVCSRVMRGSISTNTFYQFGCCSDCHIEFVEGREDRWNSGWRPDANELDRFYKKLRSGF